MNTAPIATAHNRSITFFMGSSSKVAKGPRDETGAAPRLDGDSRESHGLRPCARTQNPASTYHRTMFGDCRYCEKTEKLLRIYNYRYRDVMIDDRDKASGTHFGHIDARRRFRLLTRFSVRVPPRLGCPV